MFYELNLNFIDFLVNYRYLIMLFTADVRHHLRPELAEGPVLAGGADQVTPLSRGDCSQ